MERILSLTLVILICAASSGCTSSPEPEPTQIPISDFMAKPVCDDDTKNVTCRIDPPVAVIPFELTTTMNTTLNFSQLEGKIVIVTFLFTRCPDVCPVVAANLKYIENELGDLYPDTVDIVAVTVDPFVDNTSRLWDYADQRGLEYKLLTGELDAIEPVWANFEVGVENYNNDSDNDSVVDGFDICPDTPEGEEVDSDGCGVETQNGQATSGRSVSGRHHPLDYWVEHTTGTILVDKQMRQRAWWGDLGWVPELVLNDVHYLLNE